MPLPFRLILFAFLCSTLTSCGTASHYLGMAGGLVNSITSPVLGAIRLSEDTPPSPTSTTSSADAPAKKPYDSRPTPAKRPH